MKLGKWFVILSCLLVLLCQPASAAHIELITESDEYEQFAQDFFCYRDESLDDDATAEELLPGVYCIYYDYADRSMFQLPEDASMQQIKDSMFKQWVVTHETCEEYFDLAEEGKHAGHWMTNSYTDDGYAVNWKNEIERQLGERGKQAKSMIMVFGSNTDLVPFAVLENQDESISIVLLSSIEDRNFPDAEEGTEYSFAEAKKLVERYGGNRYLPALLHPLKILGIPVLIAVVIYLVILRVFIKPGKK